MIKDDHITYEFRQIPVDRVVSQKVIKETKVFIVRTTTYNGTPITIPSVFSSYIQDSSNSLNSQIRNAKFICAFLNYVLDESYENNEYFVNIKQGGFRSLNFKHASSYLAYCIDERGNSYETAKAKEKTLLKFYDYLNNYKIIDVKIDKLVYTDKNNNIRERIKSPFNTYDYRVRFPEKISSSKKLKNLESHIFKLFIKCCDELYPEIKLGVYLQTMGGLRLGEVVNCTLSSINIKNGSKFSSVDVLDNQEKLFYSYYKSLESNQVKKPRYNQVLLDPEEKLNDIYNKHLTLMNSRRKQHTPKDALFIDKNGYAMSGTYYKNRFYALKRYFLNKLKNISFSDFYELSIRPWGTHIGRGIFTNYCIINGYCNTSDGNPNAVLLAKLRGDSSPLSAQSYIDEIALLKNRKLKINSLKSNIKNKLKDGKLW